MAEGNVIKCCAVSVTFTSPQLTESEMKMTAKFAKQLDCLGVHPNMDPAIQGSALFLFEFPAEIGGALEFVCLCKKQGIEAALLPDRYFAPCDQFPKA